MHRNSLFTLGYLGTDGIPIGAGRNPTCLSDLLTNSCTCCDFKKDLLFSPIHRPGRSRLSGAARMTAHFRSADLLLI